MEAREVFRLASGESPPVQNGDEGNSSGSGVERARQMGLEIPDQKGRFLWLDKNILKADFKNYQREEKEEKVKLIAATWAWINCGALVVGLRKKDGREDYLTIDGNHRVVAARRRSDITELPCMVFIVTSVKQEARAFDAINTNRTQVDAFGRFKAKLAYGDPVAKHVDHLIRAAGRVASSQTGPTTCACVGVLMKRATTQREMLDRVWPLIGDVCYGHPMHERVVHGLCYIESKMPEGQSLVDPEWRPRVIKAGYENLLESARAFAAAYKSGGARIWGLGMLEKLNKGRRIKLVLTAPAEDEKD